MAQQYVIDELVRVELRQILADGVAPLRDRIANGLRAESTLTEIGLEIVAVRVAPLAPTGDVEKALQQPTREAIQQKADEATFARRALAVQKERAIGENELQNRIELARREEQLVAQAGANERRRAEEQAAAKRSRVRPPIHEERMAAELARPKRSKDGEAPDSTSSASAARSSPELGTQVLMALALRELAGQIGKIDHLTVTPELITPLLARLNSERQ